MHVFITGIAGFVGSALAASLHSKGVRISGIDNLFTGSERNLSKDISWQRGDIRDTEAFDFFDDSVDVVVHLAAQTSGERSFECPRYDMGTNITGTFNAYEFSLARGARQFINMSSMSVYGVGSPGGVLSELDRPKPVSFYGNSKLSAENMLAIQSDHHQLPAVSLRLFNAYGPNQDLTNMKQGMVSIYLAQLLSAHEVLVKGDASRVRDLVFIEDIVNALESIIFSEQPLEGSYNLSTGALTTVGELIALQKEISGIDKKVVYEGNTPGDVFGFAGDSTQLQAITGWSPQFSLEAGLSKMIDFYLKR